MFAAEGYSPTAETLPKPCSLSGKFLGWSCGPRVQVGASQMRNGVGRPASECQQNYAVLTFWIIHISNPCKAPMQRQLLASKTNTPGKMHTRHHYVQQCASPLLSQDLGECKCLEKDLAGEINLDELGLANLEFMVLLTETSWKCSF